MTRKHLNLAARLYSLAAVAHLDGGETDDAHAIIARAAEAAALELGKLGVSPAEVRTVEECQAVAGRLLGTRAPSADMLARYEQVAELWNSGASLSNIAATLFTNVNTASAWVRRARAALGVERVPLRPPGRRALPERPASPLDALHAPGDVVTLDPKEAGGRSNVYQNARTRGWLISLKLLPSGLYEVTAREQCQPLRVTHPRR